MVKSPPVNAGDVGSIPGSGRSPGGGNGSSLQYSCLENPTDRAWRAAVHEVAQSRTRLSKHARTLVRGRGLTQLCKSVIAPATLKIKE